VPARRLLQRVKLRNRFEVGIGKERHPAKSGHCLDQNFLPLAVKLEREDADACCITVWPGQRGHQPQPDHIVCHREDRYRFRRLLCGANCCHIPGGYDDIDPCVDQFRRIFRNQINV
jgi:hypothetical protein